MIWLTKLRTLFFPSTSADKEWYQLLAIRFRPPHAHLCWALRNNRLEMHWRQAELNCLANLKVPQIIESHAHQHRPTPARGFTTFSV